MSKNEGTTLNKNLGLYSAEVFLIFGVVPFYEGVEKFRLNTSEGRITGAKSPCASRFVK